VTQRPNDSTENPNNDFLEIPRYSLELEPRPDFFLDFRKIKLLVKPRLNLKWERWEDGSRSGDTDADSDLFINEWLVSLRLIKDLFASYGRENLQWGPSYLISPSNPFFRDNGLSNPKREVPGMDFARLVWVPGSAWGFSLIANVDKGRQEFISDDFEPTYALKADYITYRKYLSLIASYRENDRGHLGAYAGWTVSNALLLYGEGTVSQGTNALYPVADPAAPFGIRMSPTREDETSLEGVLLLGGSYTLEAGPTLTAEYVFNSEGYTDSEAELCFELGDLGIKWTVLSRADGVNEKLLALMKRNGCQEIFFGFESGSQKLLDAMNKRTMVFRNKLAVKMCQDAGIICCAYMMFGFPGEDEETVNETIKFLDETKPDKSRISTFLPIPNTDIFNRPEKYMVSLKTNYQDYWYFDCPDFGLNYLYIGNDKMNELRDKIMDYYVEKGYMEGWTEPRKVA